MPEIRHTSDVTSTNIGVYDGDKRIAGLWVFDLPLNIGGCVVRCGGIGGVGTDREHRGNGYARLALDDALAYIRESGMLLSVLFGIPNFYPRWGFAPALVEGILEVDTAVGLLAPAKATVRDMQPGDSAAVAEIYARENAQRTGTVARDVATWQGFRQGVNWNDRVSALVVEDAGRVVGYAAYNSEPWENQVAEVGGSRMALAALVRCFAERTAKMHREKLVFRVPPDHELVSFCAGLGCKLTLEYPHASTGMARIIDQRGLLDTLAPLLTERLAASGEAWRGTLEFVTQLGEDAVDLGGGDRQTVRLTQERLTQLVLGYRSARDLALDGQMECAPELLPVLTAIFPQGNPYMWHPDRI